MKKFSLEANGYNRNEVNQFVSDVIKETERIFTKVKYQNKEIEQLKREIEHYKNLEHTLKNAISKAEETSNNIKLYAQREGTIIVSDAKQNASRIVNEALLKAERIENNAEILEKNMKIFKRKLKLIMEQQQAVIEEMDDLEL